MPSSKNQSLYTLQSVLRAENDESFLQTSTKGAIAATGSGAELSNPNVYFTVVSTEEDDLLQYQLIPYNHPDKYIAIKDGQVALLTEDECEESERSFFVKDIDSDYAALYVESTGKIYYLTSNGDGEIYAAKSNVESASWFRLRMKEEDIVLNVAEAALFFANDFSFEFVAAEIVLSEE